MTSAAIQFTTLRSQNTIIRPVTCSGIGLHTGEIVSIKLLPAPADTGILFQRIDLTEKPCIPALLSSVSETNDRCTTLAQGNVRIFTVEHLLAALYSNRIDNAIIEIDSIEPPVGGGSSAHFVEMIHEAGITPQRAPRAALKVCEPLWYSKGNCHLVALPHPSYKISYTLSYPNNPVLGGQYHSLEIEADTFNRELSPCRTFCLYEEISFLLDKGLIRGGSLDNAVVVDGEAVYSKGGLFFPNEMARHKILDIIGDLALIGCDLVTHLMAICSGHATNNQFARLIAENSIKEEIKA